MLEIHGIETFYGETQALFGVDLHVGKGEAVALLGPNGAGKTTVLRSILGLTPARRGAISFTGKEITRAATNDIACAGIAWVPDDRRIFRLECERSTSPSAKRDPFLSWIVRRLRSVSGARIPAEREPEPVRGESSGAHRSRATRGCLLCAEPSQGLAPSGQDA